MKEMNDFLPNKSHDYTYQTEYFTKISWANFSDLSLFATESIIIHFIEWNFVMIQLILACSE